MLNREIYLITVSIRYFFGVPVTFICARLYMKVDVKGLFLTCQTSLLFQGIALIDRNCMPEVIWYFPVEDLPEDVGERFNTLFKTREKWSLAEISPYIRYIVSPYINYIISPYATQMFSPLILIITHYISYITPPP